nr:MAG TPA: Single strand binding protein [Caudoviricetes sp.]
MNNVQLLGNLVRDVELRYTQSGSSVATFTVAATSTYKGQNGEAKELTAFVNCVAWGKNSEYMSQYHMRKFRSNVANKLDFMDDRHNLSKVHEIE